MSETPVPIPSGSVPAGAPAWSSADAAQWAQARSASWSRPSWSVSALLITVVWAVAVAPVPPCSDAAPCGPQWGDLTEVGLAAGLLYWLARLPELALVAAPALAALVAWEELPGSGLMSQAANIAVIGALAFGWAAARERLAARSRQRRLAQRAAGVRHRLPEPVGPLMRGTLPLAAGLVLCAVSVCAALSALDGIRTDEQHAARATHITAQVISRGEDSMQVRAEDDRRLTVDAFYPEDYGVGSTVTVLQDGSWRRLVSEPYDAFGPQLLMLAAGLPGLCLLASGVLARRRAAALRRAPVPALRVLEATDRAGRTRVYAADDTLARTPLFTCLCTTALRDRDGSASRFASADDDSEGSPVLDTRLHEAVMFGAPGEGGELVLVTTDRAGRPTVLRTAGPGRLPRTDEQFLPTTTAPTDADTETDTSDTQQRARTTHVAATLKTTGHPLHWGPGLVARTAGLALTAGVTAGLSYAANSLATDGFHWELIPLLALPLWLPFAAVLLNWRVTADNTGLWLTGAWSTQHVPWERLRAATYTAEGTVEVHQTGGGTWHLTALGEPRLERRLRLRPSYTRMTEEITALHAHPEVRPTEPSEPRTHGLPLGPVLLLLVGVITAAVVIG
ncbi:hypothetical protein [Streptomyces sp. Act143]|uniref:hypothetical protein n=1 Tax=Streptomyces sp. Act143 TaxID=2200760 RepID=UPI0015E81754|nr:hypothetical protein [Streptomyces sp. Act143]